MTNNFSFYVVVIGDEKSYPNYHMGIIINNRPNIYPNIRIKKKTASSFFLGPHFWGVVSRCSGEFELNGIDHLDI